jgi:hypothetical protein
MAEALLQLLATGLGAFVGSFTGVLAARWVWRRQLRSAGRWRHWAEGDADD